MRDAAAALLRGGVAVLYEQWMLRLPRSARREGEHERRQGLKVQQEQR